MQTPSVNQRPYARAEVFADALVHGLGVIAGLAASLIFVAYAVVAGYNWPPVAIYAASLVAMLGFSASYNLWPASPAKRWLRRCDHAAIFLLIAGTYTPLLPFLADRHEAWALGAVVWVGATLGVGLKFLMPGRFDRLAIAVYLGLGWAGVWSARAFLAVLPATTMALILAGGLLYSAGVIFHVWERLKFQNAIWHGFVTAAAACHFAGIVVAYA